MIDHQDIVDGQQRHPHLMRHLIHQPGERHFALAMVRLQSVNDSEGRTRHETNPRATEPSWLKSTTRIEPLSR